MFKITVDGCDYTVNEDSSHKFGFNHDYISVIGEEGLVGCSMIDHNSESIQVSYFVEPGVEADVNYNYYEYLDDPNGLHNLATWIVSTHPTN